MSSSNFCRGNSQSGPFEENSYGSSSSVEYGRNKYTWEQFRSTVESTDNFTEEFIDEAESSEKSPQEPNIKSNDDNTSEDKMCRICFSGTEDESSLGRLISPCLCKGTMRYVHVECLNQWRLRSQKKSSFFQCDECKYKYAFRRTTIAKFATNEFILTLVTLSFFVFCVFMGGFLAKFLLYLYPLSDDFEDDTDSDNGEPLFKEPITIATIFTIDYLHVMLGIVLVGIVGFIQLLFSLMWFGPIPSWNTFRFGPTGSSVRGRSDGLTGIFISVIVIIGVLKAVWGMYKLVRGASRKLLERVELTILEVNES
ncbi:hypothetical protein RclHR1_04020026 [Rhizophagus clarus]|uniref:Zf-C3HC4-domain-containing protein n=1 Tax=Rhizophagus clarus TaxID=94130 RepID=A0A2Z6RVI2_9GLOM|nr:hypothetical protein RclHR1_04020026 [Rhizophagus clarus]GES89865.1 zf-C3HC4-domain-containing protein [Rhizophagus clarus]